MSEQCFLLNYAIINSSCISRNLQQFTRCLLTHRTRHSISRGSISTVVPSRTRQRVVHSLTWTSSSRRTHQTSTCRWILIIKCWLLSTDNYFINHNSIPTCISTSFKSDIPNKWHHYSLSETLTQSLRRSVSSDVTLSFLDSAL